MSYATILVCVDLSGAAPARIRLAAGLTPRFEAILTGAAARKVPAPVLVSDISDAQLQEERNREVVRAELECARDVFVRNAEGAFDTEWRATHATPLTHLVAEARAADLVVVGQEGEGAEDRGTLGVASGPVLMEAGRPVLVVPLEVEALRAARIVVAWKDTVETRRAVSGALPFIRRADQVFVAGVGEGAHAEGAEQVAAHLARHGAAVTTHLIQDRKGPAEEILDFARRQDADLIVMGAYGHSRMREWAFGGVTRDLLRRSPVCCLMSH
ncbi:universal stress protein [Methylobacterium sp. J-076]|uniref:universal stress protein n=1 Tax=Methylobacterium sp. J-076 TaxID=2836655 RepID=UPI001FB9BD2F|nr:universal stress protein [Methylobacterium sp. J-076]MCJ2012800.1 universal stress protein [Methylobacterium sp. J-076]